MILQKTLKRRIKSIIKEPPLPKKGPKFEPTIEETAFPPPPPPDWTTNAYTPTNAYSPTSNNYADIPSGTEGSEFSIRSSALHSTTEV